MKKIIVATFMAIALAFSVPAAAGDINFGTGGPTGNYFSMGNDIKSFCGADMPSGKTINIVSPGGSIVNLAGMLDKSLKMGWVQEDVLQFNAKNNGGKVNEKRQRVILAGHNETLHLVVPRGYKPKGKDTWASQWGFGEEAKSAISLDSLRAQTIGGWGGSLVSANALNHFSGLGMNIVEVPEGQRAKPQIPVLIVGGQPYGPVQALLNTGKYTMLPVQSGTLEQRAPFYSKINANYVVNGKLVTIPTFSVRALLIAKYSRKAERNEDMVYLSKCIQENLADLADDSDTNSNWETVYELNEDNEDGDFDADWKYFVD